MLRVQLFGPLMMMMMMVVVVVVVGLEKNEASCLVAMHSLVNHINKRQKSNACEMQLMQIWGIFFVIFVFKFARPYELIHTITSKFILF
jgi:hypothetical protein